jgi:SAM-dependent methyltransferase
MLGPMLRRNREEAMDGRDLDPVLLADDLRNLEVLNRFFGGRSVVARRLRGFLRALPAGERVSILDVGSGAGDLCREVVRMCREERRPVRLWSLDAHPQIQAFAREQCAGWPEIRFIRGDGTRLPLRDNSVDVALCTLALHHFTEAAAAKVLAEMRRVARRLVLVSDLARSRSALAAVWFATRFMANPMTRFDGPVSVARAFTAAELRELARRAGWPEPALYSEPWFRMSLVGRKDAACPGR